MVFCLRHNEYKMMMWRAVLQTIPNVEKKKTTYIFKYIFLVDTRDDDPCYAFKK